MTTSQLPFFKTAIEAIFRNWSGLQFALSQGAGGSEGRAKEAWLMATAENWFYQNKDLLPSEAADFLDEIIQSEFELVMEDGSLEEVGDLLCQFFTLCSTQNEAVIVERLRSLPRCDLSLCQCEDEDDENMHRTLNDINETVEDMEVSEPVPQAPIIDEDGFQMVLRSSKKKRQPLIIGLVRNTAPLHHYTRFSLTQFRGFRTTAIMSEEQIEELKQNPYYSKYADKIAKLQNTSPEEFLGRLSAHDERKKAVAAAAPESQRDFSFPGRPMPKLSADTSGEKSLEKIMKVDLLRDKTPEEITEIWTKFFAKQEKICAVIPAETYKIMQQRFSEFKTFLFPIPRKNGYEFVMVQFLNNEAHFTTLINFQAHKENAPECLGMVHYTELMEDKGIVLMVGEYDKDTLDAREAKCLADQVEIYYSKPTDSRKEIMEKFKNRPMYFDHNDLIKEFNSIAIN